MRSDFRIKLLKKSIFRLKSESVEIMRIAILGAGGVGGYYGGMLAHSGHAVYVLARGENLATLQQKGLEVRTQEESFVVQVKAEADVKEFGPIDWAIVAVKTYSLTEIASAVRYLAETGALILPLLNGVDAAERLVEYGVPKESVLGGLTRISAMRTSPGVFERHAKVQQVVLGELDDGKPTHTDAQARSERVKHIADAFRKAGVEARVASPGDIRGDLWRKFAFLAPVAAACGLARSPIGPVRSTPVGRLWLERGIREVIAVGRAHGIPLDENEIVRIMQFCDSLPETNKPSLLRDLEAGRPTEIEDLSGAVSRLGRQAGIETPIHDTAVAAISLASNTARQMARAQSADH
jgi:2-dehydropantoate 2-reductase